jgi:hypothetical protein
MNAQYYNGMAEGICVSSTASAAKIPIDESGEGKHDEEAAGNRVELPALRKDVADSGFQQISGRTDKKIQDDQFDEPNPKRLYFAWQRNEEEYLLIQERQVGGYCRQQDDEPG